MRTVLLIGLAVGVLYGIHVGAAVAAELTGRVVDATGGSLHFTTVELRRGDDAKVIKTVVTDESGLFHFRGLSAGTYQVSLDCAGFERMTITRTVVLMDDTVALGDVVLNIGRIEGCDDDKWGRPAVVLEESASGTELSGNVADRGSARIAHASVRLSNANVVYRTVTEHNGSFRFVNVLPGLYTLRITRSGFADFLVQGIEIREQYATVLSDVLELPACPANVKCRPATETRKVAICL